MLMSDFNLPFRFLTDKGIDYLREYLGLPQDVVPATLKKSQRCAGIIITLRMGARPTVLQLGSGGCLGGARTGYSIRELQLIGGLQSCAAEPGTDRSCS